MAIDRDLARRGRVGLPFLLLAAVWLSGCAQQPTVEGAWQENVPHNQSFTRVLVVGVSPERNRRCAFEWAMVSQLKSASAQAVASCDAMPATDKLTRENIERTVASLQADSVLATILVESKYTASEGGSRDTRGGNYWKGTGYGYTYGYGVYGMPVVYLEFESAPALKAINAEVHVATKLYETHGATLVYAMDTKARDLEDRQSGLAAITAPIATRLRKEGLIR